MVHALVCVCVCVCVCVDVICHTFFSVQLKKVYKDNPGGMEAHEDLARMREHAFSEVQGETQL